MRTAIAAVLCLFSTAGLAQSDSDSTCKITTVYRNSDGTTSTSVSCASGVRQCMDGTNGYCGSGLNGPNPGIVRKTCDVVPKSMCNSR